MVKTIHSFQEKQCYYSAKDHHNLSLTTTEFLFASPITGQPLVATTSFFVAKYCFAVYVPISAI